MANRYISAVLSFRDQMTAPMKKATSTLSNHAKTYQKLGRDITKTGKTISSVGSGLTKGITAPITAIGTASVTAFNEVDNGLDIIIQKTGATGKAYKNMESIYERVYTKIPTESENVGSAIGEINTRLGLTGKELEKASVKFLKFADLNGTDVNSAIATVTRAMGDAGIATKEYGKVLDSINAVGQASGISIDALATNLTKYGAPLRALGVDTQTAMAMFGTWEKAGVNTEIAFSGMKKAISNWGKAGKDSAVEFQKTMDEIKKAPSIASATSLAIEAFGSKAGPDLADAIKGGRFEINEMMNAIENSKGSVNKTFADTQDGIDKIKTAGNSLKLLLSQVGGVISDMVGPALEKVTSKVTDVSNRFKKLDDTTKKNIVKFASIAAAVGPVIMVFGKFTTGIGGMITKIGKFGQNLKKAGSVFKLIATPGNIAVVALLAIVAAGILVYKNWDKIKEAASKLKKTVMSAFNASGASGEKFKKVFINAKDTISSAVKAIGPTIGTIVKYLKPVISFLSKNFFRAIKVGFAGAVGFVSGFASGVIDYVGGVKNAFKGLGEFISGVFAGDSKKALNGLKTFFKGWGTAVVAIFKTPVNGIIGMINSAIGAINKLKIDIPNWVPKFGGKTFKIDIPKIPMLYRGTAYWKGGITSINERGGEIVDLPRGTRVYPNDESIRMARQEGGKKIVITIPKLADAIIVREEADIDKFVNKLAAKLQNIVDNGGAVIGSVA